MSSVLTEHNTDCVQWLFQGWNVNTHALEVGKWRYEWNPKCVAVNKYDVTSIPQKKNE